MISHISCLYRVHCRIDVSYEDMRPGADDIIALLRVWRFSPRCQLDAPLRLLNHPPP